MKEEMSEQEPKFLVKRLSDIPQKDIPQILDKVVKVEKETWPKEIQAPKEKFEARAEIFPEGFLLISLPKLNLVGVSTAEIIQFDPDNPPTSWEETTDNGWIRKTHKPQGNALYLVSVGASPRSSGQGVGTQLVKEQIELAKKLNLEYLVLGSRIPGYAAFHKEHPNVSIKDYIAMKREDGLPIDPEVRFYTRCGLEIVKIVPNYMEDDPESESFGTVMIWKNPARETKNPTLTKRV